MLLPLRLHAQCLEDCDRAMYLLQKGEEQVLEGEEKQAMRGALLARRGEALQEMGDLKGAENAYTSSLEVHVPSQFCCIFLGGFSAVRITCASCMTLRLFALTE